MLIQEIIGKKRDGHQLTETEIAQFVRGLTDGTVSDAQAGAFAMAVLLNKLDEKERVSLTLEMTNSGQSLNWDLHGPVVDKHSTGGIGDNVSLILAPALAACGAFVPMISGRGLGHTGGTLDKLDAIPGYNTAPDQDLFRNTVRSAGCAIIGQTADLAPADKRLYAIRDVTGTIESIDLICASILSKKLAAGLDALVLDVKIGTGAFMQSIEQAQELAKTLTSVANAAGCQTSTLITDMNEPLASAAGNALETANAIRLLRGDEIDSRLWDVVIALGAELLYRAGLTQTPKEGADKLTNSLQSGHAAEHFGKMTSQLGGPKNIMEDFDTHLPHAPIIHEVLPQQSGFVSAIDAKAIGLAVVELGGGRVKSTDAIDFSVGLDWILGLGLHADQDTPLCRIHARTQEAANAAETRIREAFKISQSPIADNDLIYERIT